VDSLLGRRARTPLPAGAHVDHGMRVEIMENHRNRAAGRGCHGAASSSPAIFGFGRIHYGVRSESSPLSNLFAKAAQILVRNHLMMIHKPEGAHHIRSSMIIKTRSKNTTDLFHALTCCPELLSRRQRLVLEYCDQFDVPSTQISFEKFRNYRSELLPVRFCWLIIRHRLFFLP